MSEKENGKEKNRREWVKTAAIIFLSVLLVLTFFSNTIMNYSLPEVAAQYVQSGTITAKIRGSGIVESGNPYKVEVKESRKVSDVAVKVGDTVEKGDVLMYLEDTESEELKTAKTLLDSLQADYKKLVVTADSSTSIVNRVESGNVTSTESKLAQIDSYNSRIDNLEKDIEGYNRRIAEIDNELGKIGDATADTSEEKKAVNDAQAELDKAEAAIEAAKEKLAAATAALEAVNSAVKIAEDKRDACEEAYEKAEANYTTLENRRSDLKKELDSNGSLSSEKEAELNALGGDGEGSVAAAFQAAEDARKALEEAKEEVNKAKSSIEANRVQAQNSVNAAQQEHTNAVNRKSEWETKLADAQRELSNKQNPDNARRNELNNEKADLNFNLNRANTDKTEAERSLNELLAGFSKEVDLVEMLKKIREQQKLVDELTAKTVDAVITAPIAGTITALNVSAGETTSAAAPVAVMQPEGKGYTMSFSVTNDQAKRLSVGDKADLVNSWRYDDVEVTLANIKPDTTDPGQKKLLTFDVTGGVTAGQSLNVSVGQRSANYDLIVPNSAIREDNNGKFVLIVQSKSSPLGNRYVASRVDIEVLASDDTQSAVSGALYGYEFVITTSTKPVEAGKLVRLANDN